MLVRVSLVDVNPKMVKAWRDSFDENPEVDVIEGSMLDQGVSAQRTNASDIARSPGRHTPVASPTFGDGFGRRRTSSLCRKLSGPDRCAAPRGPASGTT
jgi:hypothetical protein